MSDETKRDVAGVVIRGQQPGETWEEFEQRAVDGIMAMVKESRDPDAPPREDPPLIKFMKRRAAGFPKE